MVETQAFHARAGGTIHHGSRYVVGRNSPSYSEIASGSHRQVIHSEKPNFAIDSSGRRHDIHLNVSSLDRDQDTGDFPYTVVKKKTFKKNVPNFLNLQRRKLVGRVNWFDVAGSRHPVPTTQRAKLMNPTIVKKDRDGQIVKVIKSERLVMPGVKSTIHGVRKTCSNFDLDSMEVRRSRGLERP
jgi:hypothetical protein